MGIKVVFMGTPDFAVASLKAIKESGIEIAGVITAPDKPAGRGKKIQSSAVKQYAVDNNINNILQPTNLKDTDFLNELKALNADLFVVVAFRMLPELVWNMPELGTINLHGSLLPNYRGAAPINWAVINGEEKTGVTTFFIQHQIDTGNIIDRREVAIENNDTAGTVHDKLMLTGAQLLVDTIQKIECGNAKAIAQETLIADNELKEAPKIFKNDCRINWNQPAASVYNFIRGLSPYPAAWTEFTTKEGKTLGFKIYESCIVKAENKHQAGEIIFSTPDSILVATNDDLISLKLIQQAGKKRMDTKSFLLGFNHKDEYVLAT